MKSFFIRTFILLTLLVSSACYQTALQPTSTAIPTYTQTITPNPTDTPQPSSTPNPTYTPITMITIPTYKTKQIILKYTQSGGLGSPNALLDIFFEDHRDATPLVLYSDGQLILYQDPGRILTKNLTQAEIERLLSRVSKAGFFSVETNQQQDETDLLYNFTGRYNEIAQTDGIDYCLSVNDTNSREICIYEPYKEFLNPPIKNLFQFIDNYTASNMTRYEPDRVLLYASRDLDLYNTYAVEPTTSIPWPTDLPTLETPDEKYMYLEGDNAKEAFSLVNDSRLPLTFNEKGQDYFVFMTPVLPDEKLSQP